jgi:hypothetical protein
MHQSSTVVTTLFGDVEFSKEARGAKDGSRINSIYVGEFAAFLFTVHNTTSQTLKGLIVQDALDSNLLTLSAFWEHTDQGQQYNFDLAPGETRTIQLPVFAIGDHLNSAKPIVNTATLLPLGAKASWEITVFPKTTPSLADATVVGKQLKVGGANLAPPKSVRYFGTASGPVILVDGVAQKTVPDDTYPDAILIAPKAGKKIAPGQTVTIQVQFPDGSTTNSITYTRPTG